MRHLVGRVGIVAAATLAALSFVAVGGSSAGASGTSAAGGARAAIAHASVNPTGTYEIFINEGSGFSDSGSITLDSDGTWTSSACDAGDWFASGKTVVLDEQPTECDAVDWIGTPGKKGISTSKKPGSVGADTTEEATWYATKTSDSPKQLQARGSERMLGSNAAVAHASVNPTGTYDWFLSDGCGTVCGTITLNSDGTWSSADYCDNGNWFVSGKVLVMDDPPSCEAVDWLGTPSKKGISKSTKPGPDGNGTTEYSTWYATKT